MRNHRIAIIAAIILVAATSFLAAPVRYEVDGLSMGPSLLPGDIVSTGWCVRLNRRAKPQRFERWIVTLPDQSTGLKRLIGLPGETVSIVDGDLAINGQRFLKGPRLLGETGSLVASNEPRDAIAWSTPATRLVDDAPFAVNEVSRLMQPVRDGGFCAEVTVSRAATATAAGSARVRVEAGSLRVTWRIKEAGRYAIAAGRLDGHAVAAAWPLPAAPATEPPRRCLPAGTPETWDVASPWPDPDVGTETKDEPASALALSILTTDSARVTIDRIVTWRDILYRPAADGISQWSLTNDSIFVLGDFPSGSRDSRHFGPLPVTSLRHAIP